MGIAGFSTIAYIIMTWDSGSIEIDGRRVFWVRYIDWGISAPLTLFILGRLSGAADAEVISLLMFAVLMVLAGAAASLLHSWTLFGFGILMFIPIFKALAGGLYVQSCMAPSDVKMLLKRLSIVVGMSWSVYPIVWAASEFKIGWFTELWETSSYAILDIIAKIGFGFLLCHTSTAVEKVAKRIEEQQHQGSFLTSSK